MPFKQTVLVKEWVPNWNKECECCGQRPTVDGVDPDKNVVYSGDMCGVCTWGEAVMLDPDKWNK